MRKIFLLLAAAMLTVSAMADVFNGNCGTNLTWSLNTDDGVLVIEGSGDMTDFGEGAAPWYNKRTNITALSLPTGLTSVGDYAFFRCENITSPVSLPNVTRIGDDAFEDCTWIPSFTFGSTLASIGDYAFWQCSQLTSITCNAVMPPTVGSNAFYSVNTALPVYVPASSITTYQGTTGWSSFTNIQAIVESGLQALKLVGNQLSKADGNDIQLRGWSTHEESGYRSMCDEQADFARMKANGANVARIVVSPEEYTTNSAAVVTWVKNCIDYCADEDLYCIIDWNVLNPGDPTNSAYSGAATLFDALSWYVADNNYHHVLYEICGEPNLNENGTIYQKGQTVWSQIKTYAATVLSVIKANDPNAIVIVGTPQWSQGLVFPMVDPMDEQGMNVMYGFHICGDQESSLGILNAATAFIPVFVSQWQLEGFNGGGTLNDSKAVMDQLYDFCGGHNLGELLISWCAGGWYYANDNFAAFSSAENYASSTFTDAGTYVRGKVDSWHWMQRSTTSYDAQDIDGINELHLALDKFDNGGKVEAYWDYDDPLLCGGSTPCSGNFGKAGAEDGVRDDQAVDLGYTEEGEPSNGYISLTYIAEGEWVQYTVNVTVAGNYDFEVFTNNHTSDNIMAIAVDGENALVDAVGNEHYKAIQIPPCHGGVVDGGYSDWDWISPKSPIDASKQFRIRFKTTGEHKLALAFMTECAGLGTIKLKGNPTTALDNTAVENSAVKRLVNGQLLIERDGRIYNALGVEVK